VVFQKQISRPVQLKNEDDNH